MRNSGTKRRLCSSVWLFSPSAVIPVSFPASWPIWKACTWYRSNLTTKLKYQLKYSNVWLRKGRLSKLFWKLSTATHLFQNWQAAWDIQFQSSQQATGTVVAFILHLEVFIRSLLVYLLQSPQEQLMVQAGDSVLAVARVERVTKEMIYVEQKTESSDFCFEKFLPSVRHQKSDARPNFVQAWLHMSTLSNCSNQINIFKNVITWVVSSFPSFRGWMNIVCGIMYYVCMVMPMRVCTHRRNHAHACMHT